MLQVAWDSVQKGRDGGNELEGLVGEKHRSYWEGAMATQGLRSPGINELARGQSPQDMEELDMLGR